MRVNFAESRVLMRRKNDLTETILARVSDIFGIDEKTVFTEVFFLENSQYPIRFGLKPIAQKLAAGVIRFETDLEVFFFFKQ